jgi:hypothetical protein
LDNQTFNAVVEKAMSLYSEVLLNKQKEYATEDRLHNFRVAASFQQCTVEQALFGFLAKHLVSLSDMVKSGETYTDERWDEKIGDAINYLLLLRAVVAEKGAAV